MSSTYKKWKKNDKQKENEQTVIKHQSENSGSRWFSATFPFTLSQRERRHKSNPEELPADFREIRVALMEPAVPMSHNKRLIALSRPCHAVRPEEKTARPNQLQVGLTQSVVDRVLMYVYV